MAHFTCDPARMTAYDEFKAIVRQLERLQRAAEIPPFTALHMNLAEGLLGVGWQDGLELLIVVDEARLADMEPSQLRELWAEERRAVQAVLN